MEGHARYLSSDLWQLIFSGLGIDDLKSVSLCCRNFLTYSNLLKERLKVIHPEISMLSRHLNRFKGLKHIDLSRFEGDTSEAVREMERSGISSTLEALNITIDALNYITIDSLPPNLKALNCKFKHKDISLDAIANAFPNLEQVRIEARPPINDIGLGFECSKLKLLKKIGLYWCNVGDQFIIALSLNCVFLKDVAIGGVHHVTESGVGHLLRNRPNLEAFSFHAPVEVEPNYYSSSINIENSVGHNKALTSLQLYSMRNTDEVLKAIATKLGLNNLVVKHCKDVTASGLLAVLSNGKLTKLRLRAAFLTEEDWKLVVLKGNVSSLTHMEISFSLLKPSILFLLPTRCPSLVDIKASIQHEQVELLHDHMIPLSQNQITSLRLELILHHRGVSNDVLFKQLGLLFPNLKLLHLSHCSRATRTNIEAILKSCKQITELDLSGYREGKFFEANDPELVELNLEVLTLSHSRIDDEALAAIAKKCPRLLSLDLSGCFAVTTEGIKQVVRNIKTLTSLNLMHFDDKKQNYGALLEWMLSTGNLASLRKIFLQKKNFTEEQRDKFLRHGCLLSSTW